MVCSVDAEASRAGVEVLRHGGNAVDAAIATNAVLAVTQQHMCGLGGDLFAIVYEPGQAPTVLNASGRAGSGANPDRLRAEGLTTVPHRGNISAAPVPGCVDGWMMLAERYGTQPMAELVAPAIAFAADGFTASPLLSYVSRSVSDVPGNTDIVNLARGATVTRPGAARTLEAIATDGRAGFYQGEFGEALIEAGRRPDVADEYTADDLATIQADWVDPLRVRVWGHDVWTVPPNSQGYLSLAGARIAEGLDLPTDPTDPTWAHLIIESCRAAGFDRPQVLHEGADGNALISEERLAPRRARISPDRAADWGDSWGDGGTMYMCAIDDAGMGVSLIQSNARDFGSHIVVGDTGLFLHNRGLGFSLETGHPAEYGPGRRPPHTLSPALVTRPDGSLRAILGTMGGDAQPQVVLQMLTRLLTTTQQPGEIISAGRFTLASPDPLSGFETWSGAGNVRVELEPHAAGWADELTKRGHTVEIQDQNPSAFGHAHMIDLGVDGARYAGASDPRSVVGEAVGY